MSIPFFDLLLASKAFGGGGTPEQSVTTEGVPPLSFQSNGKPATAYSIVANMTQSGEPSTASPSFPQQFGDLVASGTHAGEYEVPITVGGSTKTIYLDQPLRKIGDYADTISSDGTVTRRIVEVVLTGQESWGYSSGMHKLGIDPPNLYLRELKLIACCSHYKAVANQPQASLQNGELTFLVSGSGSNLLYIRDTDYSDSATFKEQLALLYALNAPVRVWYVLAEAETETVTVPELTLANGSNTLTIGTEEQPSNVSITCTVGGGSSTPTLIEKSITANGSYSASGDNADGYASVAVSVPNSYAAGDDGKVVQNGALVSQTSTTTSSNGTIDTTTNNSVTVAVPTYSAADNGKVVQNGELSAQSTHKSVTENGTGIDTTYFSSVDVDVPNSYTAQDEGKVVSNGALVAQSSDSVTQNGTVDTTLINSLTVNVSGGTGTMYKLTTDNSILSDSDLYITVTNLFVYVFGTLRNTSSSVNVTNPVFSVPADFDMSAVGTFKNGAKIIGSSPSSQSASKVDNTIKFTGTYNYGNSYSIVAVFNLS